MFFQSGHGAAMEETAWGGPGDCGSGDDLQPGEAVS